MFLRAEGQLESCSAARASAATDAAGAEHTRSKTVGRDARPKSAREMPPACDYNVTFCYLNGQRSNCVLHDQAYQVLCHTPASTIYRAPLEGLFKHPAPDEGIE